MDNKESRGDKTLRASALFFFYYPLKLFFGYILYYCNLISGISIATYIKGVIKIWMIKS